MASLHEYFVKDSSNNLTVQETWQFEREDKTVIVAGAIARLHYDFDANAKYVSFYIPASDEIACPEAIALNKLGEMLSWSETKIGVSTGFNLDAGTQLEGRDLVFSGRIYFYSERPVAEELKQLMMAQTKAHGYNLVFRSVEYVTERNKWEKPRAFIAHDFRDQIEIAQPLAIQLQKFMCPVWFSEFSLKVGDSLRESIETGLKQCSKCVVVLTPRFLTNEGWSKREFDSIFTRELVEKRKVILPVWHEVSVTDVYSYSPILADRVAALWSKGVEDVARKLLQAIDAPSDEGPIGAKKAGDPDAGAASK